MKAAGGAVGSPRRAGQFVLVSAAACLGGAFAPLGCAPTRPAPVEAGAAAVVVLSAAHPSLTSLVLPERSRPLTPDCIPLGPFVLSANHLGNNRWTAPLPIRTRSMFFFTAPADMTVHRGAEGESVPHERVAGRGEPAWSYDDRLLHLEQAHTEAPPEGLCLRYPRAVAREEAMNLASLGPNPTEAQRRAFVSQRAHHGARSMGGLHLPAPGAIAWQVQVPAAAELTFSPGIVAPEVDDLGPSDGATLTVELDADGTHEVWRGALRPDHFSPVRVDLSAWAGQTVTLRFRSDPGASPLADYVFLNAPALTSRKAEPERVVMVFIDTLRADHLGLYGYQRPTSPTLDALATQSVVFENARSVAPWTLPSTRSVMTGQHPEAWGGDGRPPAPTLQGALAERGWATGMIAGNVYLGSNFEVDRDWGVHDNRKWPLADDQVDRGLAWLAEQEGRDALLMLHFMDAHLPYQEPASHRDRFAGPAPEALGETFHRHTVLRAEDEPGVREHVIDRYDNNIRYIDDALARLIAALPKHATVVVFSDHGEEFWEHGGFEHGHSLNDELLRVPLLLRAPGLAPGRRAEAVSLLDLAPTLLEITGQPGALPTDGRSLLPLARGEAAAAAAFSARPLGFGRPLYGSIRWGVVHDGHKFTTHEDEEHLFSLANDPGETVDLLRRAPVAAGARWRSALAEALPGEVALGWRFEVPTQREAPDHDLIVTLTVPGGVASAWSADDPLQNSMVSVEVDGEQVELRWLAGWRGGREVFVVPAAGVAAASPGLIARIESGTVAREWAWPEGLAPEPLPARTPIFKERIASRPLTLTWATARVPGLEELVLKGSDDELIDALKALGYSED